MVEELELGGGTWWRFSRYELRDGYVRPADGSRLRRYDPWQEYRKGRSSGGPSPHESLLDLLASLQIRPASPGAGTLYSLSPDSEAHLLDWCAAHGLLGILLHRVRTVVLAARWRDPLGVGEGNLLLPTSTFYSWANSGWKKNWRQPLGGEGYFLTEEPEQQSQLAPDEALPRNWPRPGVVLQALGKPEWSHESLSTTWARFFPDVPKEQWETYGYPLPESDEFCLLYAEPLDSFLSAAALLRDVISSLDQRGDSDEDWLAKTTPGRRALSDLLSPASLTLMPSRDRTFEQRWVAPSLLGSFAMMFEQDLTLGRRVRRCQVCGRIFLPESIQARYCSDRCRHTSQKRAQRARKRQAAKA